MPGDLVSYNGCPACCGQSSTLCLPVHTPMRRHLPELQRARTATIFGQQQQQQRRPRHHHIQYIQVYFVGVHVSAVVAEVVVRGGKVYHPKTDVGVAELPWPLALTANGIPYWYHAKGSDRRYTHSWHLRSEEVPCWGQPSPHGAAPPAWLAICCWRFAVVHAGVLLHLWPALLLLSGALRWPAGGHIPLAPT